LTDYAFGHIDRPKPEEDSLYSHPGEARSPALDVYQFGVLVYLILTEEEPTPSPPQIERLSKFEFMSKIVKHCIAADPAKRPTLPQILYAIRSNPDFLPEIDHNVYDSVAEVYFERVYRYAKPCDKELYDRPVDQPVSVDADPAALIRQARELYRNRKPADALPFVRKAAEANFPEGLYLYGMALLAGTGVPHDKPKGLEFLRKAADRNNSYATYQLGSILMETDPTRGLELLKRVARGFDPVSADATHLIARYYEMTAKDYRQARDRYSSAHEKGCIAGTVDYARVLLDERFGPVDAGEAFSVLQRAASRQSADAMFSLGSLYREGKGCDKDLQQAADWYERAAELQFAPAYLRLALLYMPNDAGTSLAKPPYGGQPLERALEYYEKAVEAKDVPAKHNLAVILFIGKGGVQKDQTRAQQLWKEAADEGFAASQVRYAECIEKMDRGLAIEYYRMAAAQKNAEAKDALARLGSA
jgi:TPR repeat protein